VWTRRTWLEGAPCTEPAREKGGMRLRARARPFWQKGVLLSYLPGRKSLDSSGMIAEKSAFIRGGNPPATNSPNFRGKSFNSYIDQSRLCRAPKREGATTEWNTPHLHYHSYRKAVGQRKGHYIVSGQKKEACREPAGAQEGDAPSLVFTPSRLARRKIEHGAVPRGGKAVDPLSGKTSAGKADFLRPGPHQRGPGAKGGRFSEKLHPAESMSTSKSGVGPRGPPLRLREVSSFQSFIRRTCFDFQSEKEERIV